MQLVGNDAEAQNTKRFAGLGWSYIRNGSCQTIVEIVSNQSSLLNSGPNTRLDEHRGRAVVTPISRMPLESDT
jgi:hypothetical protein